MDISVIIALIFLKICIHNTEVCLEGSVSQRFDTGLCFCVMLCRRCNFEKLCKKYQKLPVFCQKVYSILTCPGINVLTEQ